MSFGDLKYHGKSLERDIDNSVSTAYYRHIYRTSYSTMIGENNYRKHMCMQWGSWCWKQALERPDEAIKYLLGRLKK